MTIIETTDGNILQFDFDLLSYEDIKDGIKGKRNFPSQSDVLNLYDLYLRHVIKKEVYATAVISNIYLYVVKNTTMQTHIRKNVEDEEMFQACFTEIMERLDTFNPRIAPAIAFFPRYFDEVIHALYDQKSTMSRHYMQAMRQLKKACEKYGLDWQTEDVKLLSTISGLPPATISATRKEAEKVMVSYNDASANLEAEEDIFNMQPDRVAEQEEMASKLASAMALLDADHKYAFLSLRLEKRSTRKVTEELNAIHKAKGDDVHYQSNDISRLANEARRILYRQIEPFYSGPKKKVPMHVEETFSPQAELEELEAFLVAEEF